MDTKMVKSKTHIIVIFDASGSMGYHDRSVRSTNVKTLNKFIENLSKYSENSDSLYSLYFFNTDVYNGSARVRVVKARDRVPITNIKKIRLSEYNPFGLTPLYESIMSVLVGLKYETGIDHTVIILSDGQDTSSNIVGSITSLRDVQEIISELRIQEWFFVYVGFNDQASMIGCSLGVNYNIICSDHKDVNKKLPLLAQIVSSKEKLSHHLLSEISEISYQRFTSSNPSDTILTSVDSKGVVRFVNPLFHPPNPRLIRTNISVNNAVQNQIQLPRVVPRTVQIYYKMPYPQSSVTVPVQRQGCQGNQGYCLTSISSNNMTDI